MGQIALVVNKSKDLTFRDFKKATERSVGMAIKVELFTEAGGLSEKDLGSIVYMTNAQSLGFSSKGSDLLQKTTLIVDEFDSILFEEVELA